MKLLAQFLSLLVIPIAFGFMATNNDLANNPEILSLLQHQVNVVGGVDLRILLEDFRTVQIRPLLQDVPIGSCGKRLGMLHLREKRTIYVPRIKTYDSFPQRVLNTWLLHEGLGATSRFDENYGMSVGLAWLAKISQKERQWVLDAKLMDRVADPRQEVAPCSVRLRQSARAEDGGPGSTGVGGGGDPFAVQIKLELMNRAWAAQRKGFRVSAPWI